MNNLVILMIFAAFLASVSQVLLKISAKREYSNIINEYLNGYVIIGYLLLIISMLVNVFAYDGVPYKLGPILNCTSYIFVILLSMVLLKEKIDKKRWIGIAFIILGLCIFNL